MAENATTIDSLQIKVEAASTDAIKSLESLKETLETLAQACEGGAGLDHYIKDLKELDSEAGKTASGKLKELAKVLKDLQGVGKLNMTEAADGIEKVAKSGEKAASSLAKTGIKLTAAYASIRKIGTVVAKLIDKSNTYVEDLNLFNASLGQYASSAKEYAETVGDLMGIDPANWMRSQGIFQTLAEGFGIASDRAIIMSKNLTQLGYDLSSFFNIAVEGQGGAMQKLQAAISGELEPIRRLGYDLSEARLKAIALSLGIEQTFDTMTQAQKAQLRYYALLTQVTTAQGDMARTLNAPANQLRVLKAQVEMAARSLGNIFIPALNAVLPYITAFVQAVREIAQAIAEAFGFKLPEIDYSGIEKGTTVIDDMDDSLQKAGGSAKKLNELLADWDELNIIQSEAGGGGGRGSAYTDYGDWAFELPEYDFLKGLVDSKVTGIFEKLKPYISWVRDNAKEIKSLVEGIGMAIGAWELLKPFMSDVDKVTGLMSQVAAAAGMLLVAWGSINLNLKFTGDFLDSGNWGSLIASIATEAAGGILTEKLAATLFKGTKFEGLESIAGGLVFMINGGIDLKLALDKIQDEGFNSKTIVTLLKGTAFFSIGGTKLVTAISRYILGGKLSGGQVAGLTIGIMGMTIGAVLSFELTQEAIKTNDIAQVVNATSSAALSAVMAAFAAWKVSGGSVPVTMGVGGAVFTLNGVVGMSLAMDEIVDKGNVNEATISSLITNALETVTGTTLVIKSLLGSSVSVPAAAGAAAVLAGGIALAIGLSDKAAEFNETEESIWKWVALKGGSALAAATTGWAAGNFLLFKNAAAAAKAAKSGGLGGLTMFIIGAYSLYTTLSDAVVNGVKKEQLQGLMREVAIDAGCIGIGAASALYGLAGLSAGLALGAGVVAMFAAGLVGYFVIKAALAKAERVTIDWGDVELTAEQANEYAQSLYTFDVTATIKSITAVIDDNVDVKSAVSSDIITIDNNLMKISIGFNEAQSWINVRDALVGADGSMGEGTLLYKLNQLMQNDENTIQLYASLAGLSNSDGTKASLTSMFTVDEILEGELRAAGEAFANTFTEGLEDQLDTNMIEIRNNLLDYITSITNAMSKGRAEGTFRAKIGALDFSDLTLSSAASVLKEYKTIEDELAGSIAAARIETIAGLGSKIAGLEEAINKYSQAHPGEEAPREWYEELKQLISLQEDYIKNGAYYDNIALEGYVAESRAQIIKAMMPLFGDMVGLSEGILLKFNSRYGDLDYDNQQQVYAKMLEWVQDPAAMDELYNYIFGDKAWKELKSVLPEGLDLSQAWLPSFWNQVTSDYTWISKLPSDTYWTDMEIEYTDTKTQIEGDPITPSMDISGYSTSVTEMTDKWDAFKRSIESTRGVVNVSAVYNVLYPKLRAEGGFPDTGELFVAREAGAELVGTIGRRTAVANNDQIESGIAGGVKEANSEQNELLRQQNAYLRAILAKTGRAVIEPSTALARTVKRSNELLTQANG